MTALSCRSACKLNLSLEVLGCRPDGYHELRTRFQTIDLGDEIEVEAAERIQLIVDDPRIPSDARNLVWKAAEALATATGQTHGARCVLRKRVPPGGGLGGGSGDAAATLLLLNGLWGCGLGREVLGRIAAGLGSDVPFFLFGGTATGSGRGDEIHLEEDLPAEEVLLVIPPGELSTARVYGEHARSGRALTKGGMTPRIPGSGSVPKEVGEFPSAGNDLEEAVFRLRPDLKALKDRLSGLGASVAQVSGSGACLFARFPGRRVPLGCEGGWPDGVEARRCRFLTRAEYQSRLVSGFGPGTRGA